MKIWIVYQFMSDPEAYFKKKEDAKRYVEKQEPDGFWNGNDYHLTLEGSRKKHVMYRKTMPEYMIEQTEVK